MAHVTLDGGNGNDVLTVSGGLDVWLTGGAGRDTFVVTQAQYLTQTLGARLFENLGGTQTSVAAGPLQITDFQSGMGGDVLDLSSVLAGSAVGYVSGSNPFESGHLSAQQVGADTHIVFDPDGESAGGGGPDEVELVYSGLMRNARGAQASAAHWEARRLSDDDISGLGYGPDGDEDQPAK